MNSYRQESCRSRSFRGRFLKTRLDKMLEVARPVGGLEFGGLVLSDVIEGAHGVHVEVGGLALGQLNASDAEGPNVNLTKAICA